MILSSAIALLAAAALQQPVAVQESATRPISSDRAARTAVAHRAAEPPAIDGRDDDAVWREAAVVSGFRQWDPHDDADPSFQTEFKVAYDERNLYVFVRAHDPHPDSIMRALSRRDVRGPSDQLVLFIDSYNDRRTGFQFGVNPDGVKRDYAVYNDSNEDGSWNAVWDVATQVDSLGWSAEYRIPLSQLRYADADSHSFGFGVFRDIERYKERSSWPLFSRNVSGLSSQMGTLEGMTGITSSRSLEVTPYTVARNETRRAGDGFERAQKLSAGADMKLRLTPNITLDATVNPDFGQVEADPAVLNLSAFETFLSERRPFFVEGTGLYRFALNCYIVVDCSTNEGLFYSRRVGRSPVLRDDYGDPTTPAATPIAAAVKLTGRTRNGLSFGVLDAVTQHVDGVADATVEPRTNYAVISAEQDLRGGRSGIRLIATAVNRALDEWTAPMLHTSAYATGLSARSRLFGGDYEVAGSIAASRISGSAEAIARTQRNAVHYYQQPGDDLEFDPERTALTGHAEQVKFGKYSGTGNLRFETSLVRQSAGFDVNDLGYLRRADQQDWSTWSALRFNTPRGMYRWFQVNGNHWQTWNTSGTRLQMAFNANAHMGLHNNWNLHAGGTVDGLGESYCDRCTRGGPLLRRARGFFPWFGVNGDNRRTLVPSMWVNLGYNDEGRTRTRSLSPSLSMRFSTRLQAQLGANASNNEYGTQWFGNFTEDGVTHHSFARLEQRTLSMNVRVNYTARPDLTLELYGEPFVSTGTYSDFRELSSTPGADRYVDRFVAYSPPAGAAREFSFRQLRTNAVMRWEYRPGSTLFLVWAHGRQGSAFKATDRGWGTEYRDLFELHPDNTFLVKLAYWFNR